MEKEVIFFISSYKKKYYEGDILKKLPKDIKTEIKKIGFYFVFKISGTFSIGFYENGDIFMETSFIEGDFDYDEIGAKLEIEKIKKEKDELFKALKIWYKIFSKLEKEQKLES